MVLRTFRFDVLPQDLDDTRWVRQMQFLVSRLSFEQRMEFVRELFGQINQSSDDALFYVLFEPIFDV